jgi:flagellin FlaB
MKHLRRMKNTEGDMGIGTMILFIAMVLVAAIAAALLISTAGDLNQQAQETGRLAQQEVSSGFQVVEVFGIDCSATGTSAVPGTADDDVDDLYLKIKLNAGSQKVDMSNVVIEVTGKDFERSLTFGDWDTGVQDATGTLYAVEKQDFSSGEITDPDGLYTATNAATDSPIVSQGTLLLVHIAVDEIDTATGANDLTPQEIVTVKIIPKHGTPTVEVINIPEALVGNYIRLK